ncbi:MAG TPA: XF1762 family protein [Solirubrobacteraceae bacterium]|nr:XF1762 family protein [Solirubrobacteraceae bacterium]
MWLVPVTLRIANAFIVQHHRHNKPVPGCVCVVGVTDGEALRGVVVIARPVARRLQDGYTAEVRRCCTDGAPNACSMLYRAAWRAVKALGYRKLVTYTLPEEGGASLRASGFTLIGETGGGRWRRPDRPATDTHPPCKKLRWELPT